MRIVNGMIADFRENGFQAFTYAALDIAEMTNQRDALVAQTDEILNRADTEGRDVSSEELKQVEEITNKVEDFNKRIALAGRLRPVNAAPARRSSPEPVTPGNPGRATVRVSPIAAATGTHGFNHFGEFCTNVRRACIGDQDAQQRFLNVATTFGNEQSGQDGGYIIPPDFRATIWEKVNAEDSLLSRATPFVTSGNSITFPKDETAPWDSTGGIQCKWDSEGGQMDASKPSLQLDTARLAKLTALVPVSDEMLEDAPAIDSYLRAKAPTKMVSKINTAIIRGNGVGKPLGILNAASLISVSAEASQDVATILHHNIENMWARMYAPCRRNAVWLVNQDCEPQLGLMSFRDGAATPVPIYMPAGGISASPYASLKGRPVVPIEACSTVGTVGDIILVDMSQYMALTKGQQIKTDVSMHLYFDQALIAFRFIFRLNGQPLWTSSITPENGSMTRSWAVALATRP
jgi:HK97 family phage major capsid protein